MGSKKAKEKCLHVMVKQRPKTLDLQTSKQLCKEKKKGKHQKPAKKQILVAEIIRQGRLIA